MLAYAIKNSQLLDSFYLLEVYYPVEEKNTSGKKAYFYSYTEKKIKQFTHFGSKQISIQPWLHM